MYSPRLKRPKADRHRPGRSGRSPFTATPEEAAAQVRAVSEHYRALQKHTAPSLPLTAVLTAAAAAALAGAAYGLGQPYWITLAAAALPILCGFLRTRNRRRAQELADAACSLWRTGAGGS